MHQSAGFRSTSCSLLPVFISEYTAPLSHGIRVRGVRSCDSRHRCMIPEYSKVSLGVRLHTPVPLNLHVYLRFWILGISLKSL
jgi:hypothetical protein